MVDNIHNIRFKFETFALIYAVKASQIVCDEFKASIVGETAIAVCAWETKSVMNTYSFNRNKER